MDHSESIATGQPVEAKVAPAVHPHDQPNYLAVFIVLAVITAIITAVELSSGYLGLPRPILNAFYVAMAVAKASVA